MRRRSFVGTVAVLVALAGPALAAAPAHAPGVRREAGFTGGAPLPADPETGLARNQDGEPGIAADGAGTIWVGSDVAPYAKNDPRASSGLLTGEDIWKSVDGGRTFRWVADPFGSQTLNHGGLAGEDSDIAAATRRNARGFYNVYAVSLWVGSTSLAFSTDGGNTWTVDPLAGIPAEDRPWVAAAGACSVYVGYHQLPTFSPVVNRYDLCRASGTAVGEALNPVSSSSIALAGYLGLTNAFGKIEVDNAARSPYRGSLYVPMANCDLPTPQSYVSAAETSSGCPGKAEITIAVSRDGGRTFGDHLVAVSDTGALPVWPDTVATDAAGTVYLAWFDGRTAFLSVSRDGGVTWAAPRRINGAPSLAAVYPTVTAGGPGRVSVAWYGTDRYADSNDLKVMGTPNTRGAAVWRVYVASSTDGGEHFTQQAVTGPVHTGVLCTQGDGCAIPDSRNLLDDFGAATSPVTGLVSVAYTSDQPTGAQNTAFTGYTSELASPAR